MSQENVEIARQAADAMLRRDRAAWLALHEEDFEVIAIDDWPEAGVRGAEAAWDFYGAIYDAVGRVVPGPSAMREVQQVDAPGDKVLVNHRPALSGRSGAEVEFNYWCVVTFRQGRIVREHWFANRAEALEAAGLSE